MKKGFTLIEILVSVTILAVLTAIAVTSYSSINKKSRDTKRKSDLSQLQTALEMYRSDYGYYPNVNTGSFATADNLNSALVTTGGYMPAIPDDPSSSATYYYASYGAVSGVYYKYCVCTKFESTPADSGTCSGAGAPSLPAACNYGAKNP